MNILNIIPDKYKWLVLICAAALPYLTRGLHAWLNRGDLRSVVGAIFFGTNTPAMTNSLGDDKRQTQLPLSVILLFVVPCSLLFMAGCAGGPNAAGYKAAGTTFVSVDAAMSEWGAYVAAKHPPASQEQAVKTAYEKYQAGMAVVCDAGAVLSSASQTNSPAAAAALATATGNLSAEIADLETLIAQLTSK